MLGLIRLYLVSAGGCVPVTGLICRPLGREGVLMGQRIGIRRLIGVVRIFGLAGIFRIFRISGIFGIGRVFGIITANCSAYTDAEYILDHCT